MVMTIAALLEELHVFRGTAVDLEHDLFSDEAQALDVPSGPSVERLVDNVQKLTVVTFADTLSDLLLDASAIEPVQLLRVVNVDDANRVSATETEVLLAPLGVQRLQIDVLGLFRVH